MGALNEVINELSILTKARYPLIYIVSWEESRVEEAIKKIFLPQGKNIYYWSITKNLHQLTSKTDEESFSQQEPNLFQAINEIIESDEDAVYVLKDIHFFMSNPDIIRSFQDLARHVIKSKKSVFIVSPVLKIPQELEKEITIVDFPFPDLTDLDQILENISKTAGKNPNIKIVLEDKNQREQLLKAALGLTWVEAENVFARALVIDGKLDINDLKVILNEKKQIIRKTGMLDYFEVEEDFEHVGGLTLLKDWIKKRKRAFSSEAREFGLPEPKGVFLLGVQGCGKSLCAKVISSVWGLPLLRLDVGAIFGKWVGESEENMRKAIKISESIAPVVLWIDELEKGFSGVGGYGYDPLALRVFGTFLTWMQEKTKPVFVVATANDITSLPPELLRKGRFDEIFFVDLPSLSEREEIFKIHLEKRNKLSKSFNLKEFAQQTEGFSGAEIEQLIISALYDAFDKNQALSSEDMECNIKATTPLSKTKHEVIESLREWAKGRAVFAS